MDYLEKHVTINFGKDRCDWVSAINVEMFNNLSDKLKILDKINGNGNLDLNPAEQSYAVFGPMKKAAITSKPVLRGDILNENIITFKRTQNFSDLSQIQVLQSFGKKFSTNLQANTVLLKSYITEEL